MCLRRSSEIMNGDLMSADSCRQYMSILYYVQARNTLLVVVTCIFKTEVDADDEQGRRWRLLLCSRARFQESSAVVAKVLFT